MRALILGSLLVVSQPAWSAGSPPPNSVDQIVMKRFQKRGFRCLITEVFNKVTSKGSKHVYGPKRVSAILPTYSQDGRLYLTIPDFLDDEIGYFGFDFKEVRSLSSDYLLMTMAESGVTRRLEIDFRTGSGRFDVDATYGGWPLNDKTRAIQRVRLENCKLL